MPVLMSSRGKRAEPRQGPGTRLPARTPPQRTARLRLRTVAAPPRVVDWAEVPAGEQGGAPEEEQVEERGLVLAQQLAASREQP